MFTEILSSQSRKNHRFSFLEPLESRRLLALTLTVDAAAQGFELATFANNFSDDALGIAFPVSGGVLVSDANGDLWQFPDADGRDASLVMPSQSYGSLNTMDMAQFGGAIFIARQGFGDVVQINDNGSLNQIIAGDLGSPLGLAADPATGRLFVSTENENDVLWEIDPVPLTVTEFANTPLHDLAVSADGEVLYGTSEDGGVLGFDTGTGAEVFSSGPIDGEARGIVVGTGSLGGNLLVTTEAGTLVQVSLFDSSQTLLATDGEAGNFAAVDPRDGSVLLTQGNSIERLRTEPSSERVVSAIGETISVTKGREFTATVATFTDSRSVPIDGYSVVIDWGDGTISQGTVVANGSGEFDVVGTHTYDQVASNLTTTITISDPDGQVAATNGAATVAEASMSLPQGRDFAVEEGQAFTEVVSSFEDDSPGSSSNYYVLIDWGDSFSSEGAVQTNPEGSGFIISGSHAYASAGGYEINVQIIKTPGNEQLTIESTAFVEDAPITEATGRNVRAAAGRTFTATVARFHDGNPLETGGGLFALIDWGDGEVSDGVIVSEGHGDFRVVGTHSYTAVGTYDVRTLIASTGGSDAMVTSRAVVNLQPAPSRPIAPPGIGSRLNVQASVLLETNLTLRDLLRRV